MTRLPGPKVQRIVAGVIGRGGAPTRIRSDHGSEFICAALTNWLPRVGTEPIPVAAGTDHGRMAISSRFSVACVMNLERTEFEDVADARAKGAWFRASHRAATLPSSIRSDRIDESGHIGNVNLSGSGMNAVETDLPSKAVPPRVEIASACVVVCNRGGTPQDVEPSTRSNMVQHQRLEALAIWISIVQYPGAIWRV